MRFQLFWIMFRNLFWWLVKDGLYLETRELDTRRGRGFEILCPLWKEIGFSISAAAVKLVFLPFFTDSFKIFFDAWHTRILTLWVPQRFDDIILPNFWILNNYCSCWHISHVLSIFRFSDNFCDTCDPLEG